MNEHLNSVTADLNNAQNCVVRNLPGPLFVSAGAGSGKTKTLTSGIGASFIGNDKGFKLDSINEILAITFTEKAAAELLSRIKAKISELTPYLLESNISVQDLNVDTSWITTIHGFCARFLKENSLEIGLDPEFGLLDELQQKDLQFAAKESVLAQIHQGCIDISGLDNRISVTGSSGLLECADVLCSKALGMPNSFDDIAKFDIPSLSDALSALYRGAISALNVISAWDAKSATEENIYELLSVAVKYYDDNNLGNASLSEAPTKNELAIFKDAILKFPKLSKLIGKAKAKGGTEQFDDIYRVHLDYAYLVLLGIDCVHQTDILTNIAIRLKTEYDKLKLKQCMLDQNDLLLYTLDALKKHPNLAEKCRNTFKLIMVDEFQDTDKVQVAILKFISADNFSNVCVVGDAQQSIYGFRGADVNTFFEYRDNLLHIHNGSIDSSNMAPELEINYRSHKDILDFVECIFSDEGNFLGSSARFLKLEAGGAINSQNDEALQDIPRITFDVTHFEGSKQSDCGVQAQIDSARRIAQHFKHIKDSYRKACSADGFNPEAAKTYPRQTFALLLGKTTNAQLYIDEFQKVGLDSIMTAGSLLYKSNEARIILDLLKLAVNKYDEIPLFEVLTSDMFAVSDDVLLSLAYTIDDTGELKHAGHFQFWDDISIDDRGLTGNDLRSFEIAKDILSTFFSNIHSEKPSVAIKKLLVNSGYIDRINNNQVSSLAIVGNFTKLLNILSEIENNCWGITEICLTYAAKLERAKDTPGVLSSVDADYVQILTIHGSKGLEFDHVAVSDMSVSPQSNSGVYATSRGDKLYALFSKGHKLDSSIKDYFGEPQLLDDLVKGDSIDITRAIPSIVYTSEVESNSELRRLLYVAFTRAVKTLYIAYLPSAKLFDKGKLKSADLLYKTSHHDGIFHEIYDSIKWPIATTSNSDTVESYVKISTFETGLKNPLKVQFNYVNSASLNSLEDPSSESEGSKTDAFVIVNRDSLHYPNTEIYLGERANIRSYSSLSFGDQDFKSTIGNFELHDDEAINSSIINATSKSFNPSVEDINSKDNQDAFGLGLAFHALLQKAIILQDDIAGKIIVNKPGNASIDTICRFYSLTSDQISRLKDALNAWFASSLFKSLCGHETLSAEVPFYVDLNNDCGCSLYLEGELDALATDGESAYIVDYKTGGDISATVEAAHKFQAECYAYAMLKSGYTSVHLTFVRVEHLNDNIDSSYISHTFFYEAKDLSQLKRSILEKWN